MIVYLGDMGNTQYIVMGENFKKSRMHRKNRVWKGEF